MAGTCSLPPPTHRYELRTRSRSACHLKTENWKRALYYADKVPHSHHSTHRFLKTNSNSISSNHYQVTAKNPENTKMLFRKAKALSGIGYTEKAIKVLEDLVAKNPEGQRRRLHLAFQVYCC